MNEGFNVKVDVLNVNLNVFQEVVFLQLFKYILFRRL